MGQSQCKPCSPADPTADTVKVDSTLLAPAPEGPSSPKPAQVQELQQEAEQEQTCCEVEERREAEEHREAEERRLEQQRREEEDKRQQLEEERRQQLEEQERQQLQAEQERLERQRAQEEEEEAARRRQEEADRAEQERRNAEIAKQEQERTEKKKAEKVEAQKKVDVYLRNRGFKSLTAPRKAFCGAPTYPLHVAIEENDAETVNAMRLCGADPSQKNSAGKTAREIAEMRSKAGANDPVLVALRGGA